MSGRVSGGPSRDADAPTRTTWTRDGIGAIVAVLVLGLAFRLIIAQVNPGSGFKVDLDSFQGWASSLARDGLGGFYERDFFHDYTPGYLYVLYLVGLVGQAVGGIGDLIKIPPILADVGLGWLVWSMSRELGASRRAALIGGALVVVNPVTWFDSVLWGQVDSVGVLFLLLGLRELWRDHPERSAILTVIAALIKPQLAILGPILAVVTIRRALRPPAPTDPAAETTVAPGGAGFLERVRAWEGRTAHPVRILTTGAAGFLTAVVLCFPFGLSVVEPGQDGEVFQSGLIEQVFKTAGGYPYASVNAYNPWALAEIGGNGVAVNGGWACDTVIESPAAGGVQCPLGVTIGPVPAVFVGAALLAAAFVVVCLFVAWRPTPLPLLVGLTILSIAFFILPTRVHERYLFPYVALGAILAAISVRWRVGYLVLSLTMFLNMYVVLTTLYPNNPGVDDWLGIGSTIRDQSGVTLVALTALAASGWAFVQLRPAATIGLERELASSADKEPASAWHGAIAGDASPGIRRSAWLGSASAEQAATGSTAPVRRPVSMGPALGSPGATSPGARPPARPTWTEPASFADLGAVAWFRARLAERPVRADRSRALHDERPGRLDRLDIWLLAVLLVSILGMRMFRLGEPYQMHFDEVYHARTATEFLQQWRYGISHDIYEWTHPHLAKYAMAGGLVAWGDDRVTATSDIGVPVLDALIEPRSEDPTLPHGRAGDRIHVATGSEVRSYDLVSRARVATIPVPGATSLAFDPVGRRLFIGSSDGSLRTIDPASLDSIRALAPDALAPDAVDFATVDGAIRRLFVPDDGSAVVALTSDDRVITLDPDTAAVRSTVSLKHATDIASAGTAPTLVTSPGLVADPPAAASAIATILGGSADTYQGRFGGTTERLAIAGISGEQQRTDIQAAIDDGRLAGLSIESLAQVGVADENGLALIDPSSGTLVKTIDVGGAARGLGLVTLEDDTLYVTIDPDPATDQQGRIAIVAVAGDSAKDGPALLATIEMPGPVTRVAYDTATEMVHVLGRTQDGSAATVYVIEPHARSVYADARLPIEPTAWAIDAARMYPTDDRQQVLAFDGAGKVATVDVGQHEFAWRLPGVIAGVLMAGFLFLLARVLFRRRSVAIFVAILCAADGMLFVQSRIGMNDAYVGLGIVAAYTLFGAVWTGAWQRRGAFWLAMPLIGVFLGLALASKWVALYAIGGMGILILVRSALGRFLTIALLIAMTAILGYLAINVPAGSGFGNLPFVAIMVGLTIAAVVANVLHPLAWSLDEIRFAIRAPIVVGGAGILALLATGHAMKPAAIPIAAEGAVGGAAAAPATVAIPFSTPMEVAIGLLLLGPVAWLGFVVAGRVGFGPFARPPAADDLAALLPAPAPPPSADWLRLGSRLGAPAVWMIACLLVVPVGIYVLSYVPWSFIDNHRLFGEWPNGHTGQSLTDLTGAMYAYHNNLTAPHAASSPWWAWLLDLKPVWFYQEGLAGNTTAAIYDAGNLVIWWLGVPALGFAAWQAFTRRSLPLALIMIGFAFQWISWARIDRAAFQYHYYTSLPFLILALAYLFSELWHGASRRTWLLARISAGIAVLGPALLWFFDRPLCGFVGVEKANAGSQACPAIIPQFLLTTQTAAMALVVGAAVIVVVRQFGRLGEEAAILERGSIHHREAGATSGALLPLALTAAAAIFLTVGIRLVVPDVPLITLDRIPVEPIVLVLSIPAVLIAALIATARDARRFVTGAMVAIVGWFIVVYPNFSALPLPTAIANVYQGVLPTYLYAFQFPVNNVAATVPVTLIGPVPLLLAASMVFLALVVGYAAWIWRLSLAERLAEGQDALELGAGPGSGTAPGAPRGAGGGAVGD
ncbi:MAG TPA: phospholipid carrier-dependent glycosyltransferase [Patescibacteria group bacterium]|nr:phospholipid carrier-dependent glycosyltransferase [Patescibacteria group bacterium]